MRGIAHPIAFVLAGALAAGQAAPGADRPADVPVSMAADLQRALHGLGGAARASRGDRVGRMA